MRLHDFREIVGESRGLKVAAIGATATAGGFLAEAFLDLNGYGVLVAAIGATVFTGGLCVFLSEVAESTGNMQNDTAAE